MTFICFALAYTVEPLRDRGKWPLKRGGCYGEVGGQYDNCCFSGVQHFYFLKVLIVAYKYVTQSKYINNTETKQK